MTGKKKLPVGIEDFSEFSANNFYYIDKTGFIAELLHNWGKVNLFTRPRRFGKSLTMSMLQHFFEVGRDKALFDGLRIARENELCESYMGRFPVISVTLKGVEGNSFENACEALKNIIGREAERFSFLQESNRLMHNDQEKYRALVALDNGCYSMNDTLLLNSLQILSALLRKHYKCKVIVLVDEYDVPLDKAFQSGYYDQMVALLRGLLGNVLKTNDDLQFAVLTGCLRISRESIFTGLNNLRVNTITDAVCDEYFGFTDREVRELLEYYDLADHHSRVKEWYDGYRFGNTEVYCPWDVMSYCYDARINAYSKPKNYWANTSGNTMVRRFIDKAGQRTRMEIERLIAGESITKPVNMELTYDELDTTIENLWSVLFTTGYLTQRGGEERDGYKLAIPNREIRELFILQINNWFRDVTRADAPKLERFCSAFLNGDAAYIEQMLNDYLWNTISIRDTSARRDRKENFYHGILLGLLGYDNRWLVKSNVESGECYSDIQIETQDRIGVVIEVKYAEDGNLEMWCEKALEQIEGKEYITRLTDDGMQTIRRYGIAFYKKRCKVLLDLK